MLHLLFRAGTRGLALEAASVDEVVPHVDLSPVPGAPAAVRGSFSYRGRQVLAVDAARLAAEEPPPDLMSARILVVSYPAGGNGRHLVGLLATSVTGTFEPPPESREVPSGATAAIPWITTLLRVGDEVVPSLRVESFLPGDVRALVEEREEAR